MPELIRFLDNLSDRIGRAISWLTLTMVLVQFLIVVMRYVFSVGSIMMQESVVYMHALVFMIGAAYTLLHDGHVRVDVFYRDASDRTKAWVDLLGVLFFLIPVSILIAWISWPYVVSSWEVFEGSKETSGIQAVFLLKTVILVFCALIILQGISLAARSGLILAGTPMPTAAGER